MGNLQKFMLGGLDTKSNDLIRDPMRASSMMNVTKTINGDLDKRNGYQSIETFADLKESCYSKSYDQEIFVKTDGHFYKSYAGARQDCSIATLYANSDVIYTEYQSNLYFTTSDGLSDVLKFDGSDSYVAGMPAPLKKFSGSAYTITAGTTYFFRFFYGHKDLNGNITYGPYVQAESASATPTIVVSTMKTANPFGKFFNKYMTFSGGAPVTLSNVTPGTTNKMPYTTTNYIVGDKFLIDDECLYPVIVISGSTSEIRQSRVLTITAIGGGFITFDPNDLVGFTVTLTSAGAVNIDTRSRLYVFKSLTPSFGYMNGSSIVAGTPTDFILDNSQDDISVIVTVANPSFLFEKFYNEDGQKIRPPKCKYLSVYGDQLIFGNIIGAWGILNDFAQYNNDDLLMYSDTGIADNGENNSNFIQKIGESYDGAITGIRRCNDLLIVTKNNSIFALDGIIAPDGYSLRRVSTNYIGCLSHKSILPVDGGLIFNGNDGIYFTDGASCSKISQIIDPFFTSIDSSKSRSTIDSTNRKYLIYMTDNASHFCLAYSYEFKEWLPWDALDMSKGLYQKNDKSVVFAKGTKTYKFNTGYSDDGSAIAAYYKTNWEDLRNPSVDKKFKYLRVWNLNSVVSNFTLGIQKNWVNTDIDSVSCVVPARGTIQKGHEQSNIQAIRYVFANSTLSEGMLITAYEVQYEATQALDKGN